MHGGRRGGFWAHPSFISGYPPLPPRNRSSASRFRVAGSAAGSRLTIDRRMRPGDAIYIPALTFHTGGCDATRDHSMLLSVAMPPLLGEAAAREGVRYIYGLT